MTPGADRNDLTETEQLVTMQYTLWSRNRPLGQTDLGFRYRENRVRCGWLHPTDLGYRLLPIATAVAPALRVEWAIGPDETARADILAAADRADALELELRAPNGARIETEDIGIIDTHYLESLADCAEASDDEREELAAADLEEIESIVEECCADEDEAWSEETVAFPRYQIQVRLVDDASVP
jgi:hypothetical protein